MTDAAGDDQAEISGTNITARLGTGANTTSGGSMAAGASTTASFQVTVNASDPSGQPINNSAAIASTSTLTGSTLPLDVTNNAGVIVAPSDITIAKSLATVNGAAPTAGQSVAPGDVLGFIVTVANAGLATDSTVLTETVGTGLSYTGSGEGWSAGCTTAGTTCTHTVTLPGGGTALIHFTETVDSPLAAGIGSVGNTVTASNGTVTAGTVTVAVPLVGSWALASVFAIGLAVIARRRRLRLRLRRS
jgi:hypothetical protein